MFYRVIIFNDSKSILQCSVLYVPVPSVELLDRRLDGRSRVF